MAEPEIMRIELTEPAKRQLEKLAKRLGMTQTELVSRLTEWFTKQPHVVQAFPLGCFPESIAPEVARLILDRSPASLQ